MLKDLYLKLRGILSEAEIEAPELEARLLIEGVTGMNRASQIANSNSEISGEIQEKLISSFALIILRTQTAKPHSIYAQEAEQ